MTVELSRRSELTAGNIMSALAGGFLLASPWLFGFASARTAAWSAWTGGALIAGVALIAVAKLQAWEEWLNLALGLCVAAAPWALGFAGLVAAMWTHVGVGLAVAILAAVELWMMQGHGPARTT